MKYSDACSLLKRFRITLQRFVLLCSRKLRSPGSKVQPLKAPQHSRRWLDLEAWSFSGSCCLDLGALATHIALLLLLSLLLTACEHTNPNFTPVSAAPKQNVQL